MSKWISAAAVALALAVVFSGCNPDAVVSEPDSAPAVDRPESSQAPPEPVSAAAPQADLETFMISSDNRIDFQTGLECSAFASAYLLRHFGEEADGFALYEDFPGKLSRGGVMPNGIVEFFQGRGYRAEFESGGTVERLKELVGSGTPVIVFIHVKEPYSTTHDTHYVPMIGYDEEYFYLAESLPDYANCKDEADVPYNRKTEISKFIRLWENIDGVWDYPYFVVTKR